MKKTLESKTFHVQHQLKDTPQAFLLSMDIPGVKSENIEIEVESDMLHIKTKRKSDIFSDNDDYIESSRSLKLVTDVDVDKILAHVEDGVLYLTIPKIEKVRPRKIEVTNSTSPEWNRLIKEGESDKVAN